MKIYHGTSQLLNEIHPFDNEYYPYYSKCIFATSNKELAIAYAGHKWNQWDIMYLYIDGGWCIQEMRSGAFKQIFSNPVGYVYELFENNFEYLMNDIYITTGSVQPNKIYIYENLFEEIKRSSIKLKWFTGIDSAYKKSVECLKERILSYKNEETKLKFLQGASEKNPYLMLQLVDCI